MAANRRPSHNGHKSGEYVRLLGYVCANPECNRSYGVEGHHIFPCARGGPDAYWNVIALCRKCHDKRGLHGAHRDFWAQLDFYKARHEMRTLGFYLDENEPHFEANLNRARQMAREREKAAK